MNGPFMPIAFSMPFPQQPDNGPRMLNEPPARVQVALEFLRAATFKQMKRVAINDLQIQEIDGQALTNAERLAHEAAADMLQHYFRGEWKADALERRQRRKADELEGVEMKCFECQPYGRPRENCPLCRGAGDVLVIPLRKTV